MPKANVSQARRERIYQRDNYACWYCGRRLQPLTTSAFGTFALKTDRTTVPTLDHLEPQIRGGYDLDTNLVTACRRCNSRKGRKTLEEYRKYLVVQKPSQPDNAAEWIRGQEVQITFWGERLCTA